jgi:hypothetical protein
VPYPPGHCDPLQNLIRSQSTPSCDSHHRPSRDLEENFESSDFDGYKGALIIYAYGPQKKVQVEESEYDTSIIGIGTSLHKCFMFQELCGVRSGVLSVGGREFVSSVVVSRDGSGAETPCSAWERVRRGCVTSALQIGHYRVASTYTNDNPDRK